MTRLVTTALVALLALAELSAQSGDFRGRVFDQSTNTGVQNLEVRLTPPRQAKSSARIATTARDGTFVFRQLPRGRYLLEVSRGATLVYRAEVDTARTSSVEVPLQKKK